MRNAILFYQNATHAAWIELMTFGSVAENHNHCFIAADHMYEQSSNSTAYSVELLLLPGRTTSCSATCDLIECIKSGNECLV